MVDKMALRVCGAEGLTVRERNSRALVRQCGIAADVARAIVELRPFHSVRKDLGACRKQEKQLDKHIGNVVFRFI